jgi:peptide/nickel transport system substrate-binding protein
MSSLISKMRTWWQRLFFWQQGNPGSKEFKPEAHHDHALVLAIKEPSTRTRLQKLRFLNHIFSAKERQLFWGSVLVSILCLGLGGFLLSRPHLMTVPTSGGTLTEAVIGTPKLINPLYAPLNDVDRDLCTLIYSGLFRVNESLEPVPDLVERYHWSPDGKTLEVSLRKDARFQDGVQVTARDVVFTYETARDASWRSPVSSNFKHVEPIRVDDETVQFHLDQPDPNLLMNLTLGILPAHIWEDVQGPTAGLAEANLKPIGSGPYQLESFKRDQKGNIASFKLSKFPGYYGQAPYLDSWQFRFYTDRAQAQAALQNKQVDAVAFVPWKDVADLKHGNIQSATIELPQETVAFFNVKNPLLKDIRLRQALNLAVDRNELQELIGNNARVVDSPFPFMEASSTRTSDIDGARILLNTLGWRLPTDGSVRVFEAPPVPTTRSSRSTTPAPKPTNVSSTELALTIDLPNQADLIKVAELLKRRWSLIGVRVDIQTHDPGELLQQVTTKRDYQVLLWNVLLPPTQDISAFWQSDNATDQGLNLSNLADHDIDQALDATKAATSTAALDAARRTLSATIIKQTPALFLLRPAYAYLLSENVQGVHNMHLSRPSERLLRASDWYLMTSWKWK